MSSGRIIAFVHFVRNAASCSILAIGSAKNIACRGRLSTRSPLQTMKKIHVVAQLENCAVAEPGAVATGCNTQRDSPDRPAKTTCKVASGRYRSRFCTEARLLLLDSHDREFVLIGEGNHRVAIKHQGFAGADAEAGRTGDNHRFDRRYSYHRHIKSHVLIRLR